MPIFCQKNVISLKNAVLSYIFFQILHEKTPRAVIPIFGPKTQFYQNYTILWAKKVKRMPFMGERMGSRTDWGGVGSKAISSNFLDFYNLWVTKGSCPHILYFSSLNAVESSSLTKSFISSFHDTMKLWLNNFMIFIGP